MIRKMPTFYRRSSAKTIVMRPLLLVISFLAISLSLLGQQDPACLRTYDLLKTPTLTKPSDLNSGSVVFLSRTYLDALRRGVFATEPSGLKHYEYLRPASRDELRDGLSAEAEDQIIAGDGNVYHEVRTVPGVHFFTPKPNFQGDLHPAWQDPFLQVPAGLNPIDVSHADGIPLQVIEYDPEYLRLQSPEAEWIFFTGYPELSFVFDSEPVRKRLAEKQRLAEALVGQSFQVELKESLRYRPELEADPIQYPSSVHNLEITVEEVLADHEQVLLGYGTPRKYLVLDEASDARLYDLSCLRTRQREVVMEDPAQMNAINQALDAIIDENRPIEVWANNDQLVQDLQNRFRLPQDDQAAVRYFEHAFMHQDDLYRKTYLTAILREDGEAFLQSHYASERGLYHTRIEIEIDGNVWESTRISTLDQRNQRSQVGGYTVEEITFDEPADQAMLPTLAARADQPLRVKYVAGGSFVKEEPLPEAFRMVIRDVYLMSQLIRYRNPERGAVSQED